MNTYYLNNSGSRWIVCDSNGTRERVTLETKSGKIVERAALFYESFGNFGLVCISYKGKKIKVFMDTLLND